MRRQVIPLHPAWGQAVEHAIALQMEANERVGTIVAQMGAPGINREEIKTVADTLVRFSAWLHSLKGRPLDPSWFFGGDTASTIGELRLSKLTGHLEHIVERLRPYAEADSRERIIGVESWLEQLDEAREMATRNRDALRASRVEERKLSPKAEEARQAWTVTYVANKFLIEGMLRHHELHSLMPVIFDDLAEVQRTKSPEDPVLDSLVTDPAAPAADPAAPAPVTDPAAPGPITDPEDGGPLPA